MMFQSMHRSIVPSLALLLLVQFHQQSFCLSLSVPSSSSKSTPKTVTPESSAASTRRAFFHGGMAAAGGLLSSVLVTPMDPSNAVVYMDPAMYGDQENRVAAVDSLREAVRRAILKKPELAVTFYQMALLDGLSFDFKKNTGGPDGSVVRTALSSKSDDPNIKAMQECCFVLIDAAKILKRKTAITISDAVAIGGAEAIDSIGGPVLSVQLGRTDAPKTNDLSPVPLNLLSDGNVQEVQAAFRRSGMTEREMTALLGALLTLQLSDKTVAKDVRGKALERGKMGRMSDFKRITEEDIQAAEDEELLLIEGDEQIYIAESFGTRDQQFGKKVGGGGTPASFNSVLKGLNDSIMNKKKTGKQSDRDFGWVGKLILDENTPNTQQWLTKYGTSNLSYEKDLKVAYYAVTQLGAEYTGGKYEAVLKDRPRKTLKDFD